MDHEGAVDRYSSSCLYRVHVAQNPLPEFAKAALQLLVGLALELCGLALGLSSNLVRLALCLASNLVRLALGLTGSRRGGLLYGLGSFLCGNSQSCCLDAMHSISCDRYKR
jgi:hypothetical protein